MQIGSHIVKKILGETLGILIDLKIVDAVNQWSPFLDRELWWYHEQSFLGVKLGLSSQTVAHFSKFVYLL